MIPIQKECECVIGMLKVYEKCFFCGQSTDTWHVKTNQPVCQDCSKIHKVAEIPKAHPKYDHKQAIEWHSDDCKKLKKGGK